MKRNEGMTIAVASGKGGTGKTTVAVSLALTAPGTVRLVDCDVEEPNAHLFLNPVIQRTNPVSIPVPEINREECRSCGRCAEACRFGALVLLRGRPHVFPSLCKGCGACSDVCARGAIKETDRTVGVVEEGTAGAVAFVQGRINVGETATPRVIRAAREMTSSARWTIVDSPPGASCAMTAAVRGADMAVLVTEPTPFGLHDLDIAVDSARKLGVPCGIVVNRHTPEDLRIRDYCVRQNILLLAEIPDDRRAAEAYSRGKNVVDSLPGMKERFVALWKSLSAALKGNGDFSCEGGNSLAQISDDALNERTLLGKIRTGVSSARNSLPGSVT
ncbi:MAG: ATP-binding protein [Elusimicrobia bacterium]|nr:ATP-binding protein [Elusimicrobiota bacterium]